jgi:hypothetical protein
MATLYLLSLNNSIMRTLPSLSLLAKSLAHRILPITPDQLGGQAWAGNWSTSSEFQISESDAYEAVLFTRDGRPFHFIACVPGWHYRTHLRSFLAMKGLQESRF